MSDAGGGNRPIYETGPFRVDPVRRLLLRDGEPVAITPKAFSVLLTLLESRDRIVPKDELIRRVWGDPQVSDANVMQNVSAVRKALGERAGDSRYIITVAGEGYRFVGPVAEIQVVEERGSDGDSPTPLPGVENPRLEKETFPPGKGPDGEGDAPQGRFSFPSLGFPTPGQPAVHPRRTRPGLRTLLAVATTLFLIAAGALLFHRFSNRPLPSAEEPAAETGAPADPLTDEKVAPAGAGPSRPGVAILALRNLAGDERSNWLGPAFAEMLATELGAGGRVRVLSGENVARIRRSLGDPAVEPLGADSLRKIHNLVGADLVIEGAYLSLPADASRPGASGRVRLDLRVLSVPQGDVVASVAEVGTAEDLFGLVSRTGARLRHALGLTALTPAQARAAQALLPATREGTRLYVEGLERLRSFDHLGALRLLREAARIDPQSALVRSALAQALLDLGDEAQAEKEASEAVRLAASLPGEERLAAQAQLHTARREWDKAAATYRALWALHPDNAEYGLQLVTCLTSAGQSAEASTAVAALRRLPPPLRDDPRIDLAEARVAKRIADPLREKRLAETAAAKGKRSGESLIVAQALLLQGDSLLLLGRPTEALQLIEQARELFAEAGHHLSVAITLVYRGAALHELSRLDAAEQAHREALAVAERVGSVFWVAAQKANLGLLAQDRGDLDLALDLLEDAHALYQRNGDRVLEARALNAIGTIQRARGDLAGAQRSFEQTLTLTRETGNRTDEAKAASFLGTVMAQRGQLREALRLHESAFALLRQMGDESRAAEALAESARVLMARGDLPLARRRLEKALEAKRRAGDRIGSANILDILAELAARQGDLDTVRKQAGQQLRIGRETGAPAVAARALHHLGAAALDAGDLAGAGRDLNDALREGVRENGKNGTVEELEAVEVRLDLARLALAEGKAAEAARLAREAAVRLGESGLPGGEARGFALLAEAQARQGKIPEAEEAARRSRDALTQTEDAELPLQAAAHLAWADAARGDSAGALRELRQALAGPQVQTFPKAALEARLTLGRLLRASGDPTAPALLAAVRRDAEARGLRWIARQAGEATSSAAPSR